MFESLLTVKYLTSKDCFCCLSVNNFKNIQTNVVKLLYNDNETTHVSVAPSGATDDLSLGISSLFAKTLHLEEGSLVAVSEISKPPTIQSVTVTTWDEADYYVLESLAESVQSTLLEQITVLTEGQKFVIWIGKNIHVTASVCAIKPISPGKLDNLTEVVIKPPEKEFKPFISDNKPPKAQSPGNNKITFDFLTNYKNVKTKTVLRIVPFKDLKPNLKHLCQPFSVFVTRDVVSSQFTETTINVRVFSMKLLSTDVEKSVYVRLYILEEILPDLKLNRICSENLFISDTLLEYFGSDIGSRVVLDAYNGPYVDVNEIEIFTKKNYSIDLVYNFQQFLADNCKDQEFILSPNVAITVNNKLRCLLKFQPPQAKFCVVNPEFVRNCKLFVINQVLPEQEALEKYEFCVNKYTTEVGNYEDIINKCLFLFAYNTKIFHKMYNVLITGKSGTGKTTLANIVCNLVRSFPYFIYTKKISCKAIKGKTVESLHKLFTTTFFELIHHQPSVLLLDDIHVLCGHASEGDALAQQAVYFNRVSEMLEGLFQNFCEHNAVGILATSESTSVLNKNIYATRGNHLFKNVYEISQLARNDRKKLLEFLFRDDQLYGVDLATCADKTESFVMQDMVDLANKTLFESYHQDPDQTVMKITAGHFDAALKTVTETSLSNINLHTGEKTLDDIGGLTEAKKILVETMLWPSKFPDLFNDAPLRLPSGLLLYGPPGTGKTLLAGAAAKHCGLRLISIKGPELLSKYIGASEQAVRDVFQRAQSAKPCVLFFDEFDSLAPRRGHDNTGVTDRVVNQLLTQLDGIESLSGVFVLAATSRPELLDPALLRPGRLDIHIRCSLPDEDSRLDILRVLSRSLKLSSDVDLSQLAEASDGFSGADLQAVLYTAQLDSVKDLLLEDEAGVEEFGQEIQQTQLMEALKNTRPSLTKTEQVKYEQIYRKFEGGGSGAFTPGSRATLA